MSYLYLSSNVSLSLSWRRHAGGVRRGNADERERGGVLPAARRPRRARLTDARGTSSRYETQAVMVAGTSSWASPSWRGRRGLTLSGSSLSPHAPPCVPRHERKRHWKRDEVLHVGPPFKNKIFDRHTHAT